MAVPYARTVDGLESQFGTNHIEHFLFTNLIMPKLLAADGARVINVNSSGHNREQIHNGRGEVCAQIENVTAVTFQGVGQEAAEDDRHPMLRVVWKPDISKLLPSDVVSFATHFCSATSSDGHKATLRTLGAIVDLGFPKDPRMRALEAGKPDCHVPGCLLHVLQAEQAFKGYGTYARGYLSEKDELRAEDIGSAESLSHSLEKPKAQSDRVFDLVIVAHHSGQRYGIDRLESTKKLLAPGGTMQTFLPSSLTLTSDISVGDMPLEKHALKIVLQKLFLRAK